MQESGGKSQEPGIAFIRFLISWLLLPDSVVHKNLKYEYNLERGFPGGDNEIH